ncbi:hypothetical protein pb186bvf_005540 [Paramecium bursaria]
MQQEEFVLFTPQNLKDLIKNMGFNDAVFIEEGAEGLILDVANDFLQKLLEDSLQFAQKRGKNEGDKNFQNKLRVDDIRYVLKQKLKVPVSNFYLGNE